MRDLMIDIETMGTHTSSSVLLSIAAIPFDWGPDTPGPTMNIGSVWVLDVGPQLGKGRKIQQHTQDWWSRQTPEARAHWENPIETLHPYRLREELYKLINSFTDRDSVIVWANGIVFDIGNLENLMWSFVGDENNPPWKYNNVMDARTIYRFLPEIRQMPQDIKFIDHDPVSDCQKQIWKLWTRLKSLDQVR
jgi:3'-5' exoribonuclease-like protein